MTNPLPPKDVRDFLEKIKECITVNEARVYILGWEPIQGPEGDLLLVNHGEGTTIHGDVYNDD